jgi:hypothetical protein
MAIYNLTGEDTLTLYDTVFTDFADGDISSLTYETDLVETVTGKNQNTIFAKNEQGNNGTLTLRLMRGSSDDRLMQSKITSLNADFAATELANGELRKRFGDGQGGVVVADVITLKGGIPSRKVDTKTNVNGDVEQGVAIYTIKFADVKRSIQ